MSQNNSASSAQKTPRPITGESLRHWQLPQPDEQGDKNARGGVLIIGGSTEMPGAVVLAATAALRSGVGRLRIATCQSIGASIGAAVPEARVIRLPETAAGGIAPAAASQLVGLANQVQAALIGPGMIDEPAIQALLARLLPQIEQAVLILDAGALTSGAINANILRAHGGKVILTPHAGEMARLADMDKAEVETDPAAVALRSAEVFGAVMALKGPTTWIANPDQELYSYQEGNVGLAVSGSGDTLSGAIAGLAARVQSPTQAAAWGVYLHGEAGNRLARRAGRLGFLARELANEFPPIMTEVEQAHDLPHSDRQHRL